MASTVLSSKHWRVLAGCELLLCPKEGIVPVSEKTSFLLSGSSQAMLLDKKETHPQRLTALHSLNGMFLVRTARSSPFCNSVQSLC